MEMIIHPDHIPYIRSLLEPEGGRVEELGRENPGRAPPPGSTLIDHQNDMLLVEEETAVLFWHSGDHPPPVLGHLLTIPLKCFHGSPLVVIAMIAF